ncbi:MAG: glycosyltransferase [Actinomycetota bacterium]|nr:glycosyltransferase [Actinomycetota bacterium]
MKTIDVMRVITRLNIGGPARHALLLERDLPQLGFKTKLAFGVESTNEGRIPPNDEAIFIPSLRRELAPIDDVRAYRSIASLIARDRPRIFHTHLAKAGALGRLAATRADVPIVIHTFHGHVLDEYFSRLASASFAAIERQLARRSTRLVAVSEHVKDSLLERGIGDPDQWVVIPLGLELDDLAGELPKPADARAVLGLPPEGPVVGIVGRLTAVKDHMTFLRAARVVHEHFPEAHFVVAGDGDLREPLQDSARDLVGGSVTFLGWRHDLVNLYAALDVVVLTSLNEGTPVALIEAAAAARPAVATNVGGVSSVVRDGETGWLCPPRDVPFIAEQIEKLLNSPEQRAAFGEAGRTYVTQRFGAGRLAGDIAKLYRDLLADV